MVGKILNRIKRLLWCPRGFLRKTVVNVQEPLETLGTKYGGWVFWPDPNLRGKKVILCGAGEDISFDIELMRKFQCHPVIVDPTPKALRHFEGLKKCLLNGEKFAINNSKTEYYNLEGVKSEAISWVNAAVWTSVTTLSFWQPKDDNHVSHSIHNNHKTGSSIQVKTMTIDGICAAYQINDLPLIKFDVEGAEVEVIHHMIGSKIFPKQILVELDDINFLSWKTKSRVKGVVGLLLENGYELRFFDNKSNCLFVRPV